jgi:hypothetical protein
MSFYNISKFQFDPWINSQMIVYEITKLQTVILTAQMLLCKCYFSTRQYKASNIPFTINKSVH